MTSTKTSPKASLTRSARSNQRSRLRARRDAVSIPARSVAGGRFLLAYRPQVSLAQGKLLYLLAKSIAAERILEFGTLGAYSTIWLGPAIPDGGRLITLEAEPHNAEVARSNIERAGLGDFVDLRVGSALDQLPQPRVEATTIQTVGAKGYDGFNVALVIA